MKEEIRKCVVSILNLTRYLGEAESGARHGRALFALHAISKARGEVEKAQEYCGIDLGEVGKHLEEASKHAGLKRLPEAIPEISSARESLRKAFGGGSSPKKYPHTVEISGSEPEHYVYIDRGPKKGCVTLWTESPGPMGGTWYGPEVSVCDEEVEKFIKKFREKMEE